MGWEERPLPWRHWVHDNLIQPAEAALAAAECLAARDLYHAQWVRYDNDVERKKWACNKAPYMSAAAADLVDDLNRRSFVEMIAATVGVPGLEPDPLLHGAGAHVVDPGGHLSSHLDYSLHPKLPAMERRANLVLFLSGKGNDDDGGQFALYHDDGATVGATVTPRAGRAVLWCPGDVEYHGTLPVKGWSQPRVSVAVYYLAPARPGVTRKRALFVPNRGSM